MKVTTREVKFRDPNGRMVSSLVIGNGSLHDEVTDYLDNNPEPVVTATESWLTENITQPTTPVVDASLSVSGAAADAKATGDALEDRPVVSATESAIQFTLGSMDLKAPTIENFNNQISDLKSQIAQNAGLTSDIKQALMTIVNHVIWDDDDPTGQTYIDDLYDALYPPATLLGISAVYTQGETAVLSTDSLDVLKPNLVVTGSYDDSSTRTISGYTLSGTLTSPTATITVSYEGFTATFNVNVTYVDNSLYNWDFTQSLVDSKQSATATLASNATQDANGLSIGTSAATGLVKTIGINVGTIGQFTIEVDITSFKSTGSGNLPLLYITGSSYSKNTGIQWRKGNGYWAIKDESEAYLNLTDLTDYTMFNGKTLKLQVDNDVSNTYKLYCDNVLVAEKTVTVLSGTKYIGLGGFNDTRITGLRIYEGLV